MIGYRKSSATRRKSSEDELQRNTMNDETGPQTRPEGTDPITYMSHSTICLQIPHYIVHIAFLKEYISVFLYFCISDSVFAPKLRRV